MQRYRLPIIRSLGLLTLLLLTIATPSLGQQIDVQAPSSVYEGDNFTIRFSVNAKVKDFRGPSLDGFAVVSGPHQSQSSSISIINGQASSSVNNTFTYNLQARTEGNYTIGVARCTVDGNVIESRPISIRVEKLSQQMQQQRQQAQQQRQAYDPWAQQPQPATQIDEKSLFARASVSNSHPYQGEQVIVTYKIYTQLPISQFGIDKLPGNRGFWAEDLSSGQQVKQYEETVDGRQYQVAEIRRGALFAQQSGQLSIEPLDLNVLVMVQRQRQRTGSIWDLFDDPFFNPRQAVERPLSTNRINMQVKSLPQAPEGYSGAVGHFEVQGSLSSGQVKANEAITYRITVSGSGNLMLIDAPQPQFPTAFEVYDPQITDNLKRSDNGISGSRTYEWILIPRTKGDDTIPAFNFIYFDPTTGQYTTRQVAEQQIAVAKGDASSPSYATGKDDVRLLAEDINYIRPTTKLTPKGANEHVGWGFWTTVAATICLTAAALVWGKKHRAAMQDTAGLRRRRATRMAQKRLKKAAAHLGSGDTALFYEEIYRAIWGCLADKYSIPLSQLNRDTVSLKLGEKQVPNDQQQHIMQVLQDVDIARFAPGDPATLQQGIYDEALNMIASL